MAAGSCFAIATTCAIVVLQWGRDQMAARPFHTVPSATPDLQWGRDQMAAGSRTGRRCLIS